MIYLKLLIAFCLIDTSSFALAQQGQGGNQNETDPLQREETAPDCFVLMPEGASQICQNRCLKDPSGRKFFYRRVPGTGPTVPCPQVTLSSDGHITIVIFDTLEQTNILTIIDGDQGEIDITTSGGGSTIIAEGDAMSLTVNLNDTDLDVRGNGNEVGVTAGTDSTVTFTGNGNHLENNANGEGSTFHGRFGYRGNTYDPNGEPNTFNGSWRYSDERI